MEESKKSQIEFKHIKIINKILESGDSIMISPSAKNGVRIMQIKKISVKDNEK
jgi:hypothetical protein